MCGIAGFSRKGSGHTFPAGDLSLALALAIEARGPHATGYGWIDEASAWPYFWKEQGRASKVADLCAVTRDPAVRTLIAHTRYATQGSPSVNANNHPVIAPGIVLVHNGVVTNDDALFRTLGVERMAEVDSEVIAALLSYSGMDPWLALAELRGRAAVAWLDADSPDTLHLARTTDSPLHYAHTRGGAFIFASTAKAINEAAGLARVSLASKVRSVGEGTYLRVVRGEVTTVKTFQVTRTATVGPRLDQGAAPARKGKKGKHANQGRLLPAAPAQTSWDWTDGRGITDRFARPATANQPPEPYWAWRKKDPS